ncbi:hypothetical protein D3Z52_03095 [Clostridiaceae bacterium]|nr:hypothetical protein [Clostridiaceae bacterium]
MGALPRACAAGGPARTAVLRGQRSYADGGRALPCTRDFFVKKSSKNFISPAGGTGAPQTDTLSQILKKMDIWHRLMPSACRGRLGKNYFWLLRIRSAASKMPAFPDE